MGFFILVRWHLYIENTPAVQSSYNTVSFSHWGRHEMVVILHTLSKLFPFIKIVVFWFKLHWNMIQWRELMRSHHVFSQWLVVEQMTKHYLNEWWSCYLMHIYICVARPRWVEGAVSFNYSVSMIQWLDGTEAHSASLTPCEGNPLFTDGFPSQNVELSCFLCC